jgi:hypothetical protein
MLSSHNDVRLPLPGLLEQVTASATSARVIVFSRMYFDKAFARATVPQRLELVPTMLTHVKNWYY